MHDVIRAVPWSVADTDKLPAHRQHHERRGLQLRRLSCKSCANRRHLGWVDWTCL